MMWGRDTQQAIEVLQEHSRAHHNELEKLRARVAELEGQRVAVQPTAALEDRINALELWKGKVHRLLVEETPATGREKLTKQGRSFAQTFYNR